MIIILLALILLVPEFSDYPTSNKQPSALQILNILAYGGAGQWKYMSGGEPAGENPNLNDSEWETVYLGHQWNKPNTNVWFRTTIDMPENFGGFSITGRIMTLDLYIDNGFDLFVNGDTLAKFVKWKGKIVLADNIQPDSSFVIAIRGINIAGYGKLYNAWIEFDGMEEFQQELRQYVKYMFQALKYAKRYPEKREYWEDKVNYIAEQIIASNAYQEGDTEKFLTVVKHKTMELEDTFSGWIGFHKAIYTEDGALLPWTNWRDALGREMNWYLKCPIENGYPHFVYMTFMDGNYQKESDTFIPATQNGMGIISYLKYYKYTDKNNARILDFARYMGNYLVNECSTPNTGKFPRFTRSTGWAGLTPQPDDCGSQADLPYEIEPDKGGIAGYALVLLFEETGDQKYLDQALQNARILVTNMRKGNENQSPWPFRVDYRTGHGRGEVSGNMSFILRLFDKVIDHGYDEFKTPYKDLWQWIVNYQIPNLWDDGMLWVQFFEDHDELDNRTAWAPLNLARYLIEKKETVDIQWQKHAKALIEFVNQNFTSIVNGVRVCGEQDNDKHPWGGVLSNYGAVLAMYSAAIGSDEYKSTAYQALNFCLYSIDDNGCPSASFGREECGGWQEDCHTDVIHNYMDAIAAFPEWVE